MALNSQGTVQNVKVSIEKYILDNLVTTEGLAIDWEGKPFESASMEEWIQERIIGFPKGQFFRQTTGVLRGEAVQVMLSFNIFVNPEKVMKTNRVYEIRDIVANYFKEGTVINLYDFSTDEFTTSIQTMKVREFETDKAIPGDNHQQYNLTVIIDWLAQW